MAADFDNDLLENLSEVPLIVTATRKYKVGVKTAADPDWVYNQLRFDSYQEAKRYARDIYSRWTAIKETHVEEMS